MQAAESLGPIADEVVFLGGATLGLWLSDPGAAEPRVTVDVDVVVVVAGLGEYYALGDRLKARGFFEDEASGVMCRWRHRGGTVLDVMPTDDQVLGFANRWYPEAFATAVEVQLPDGRRIRAVSPTYIVATKIEAFRNRGKGDYLASHDFEDLVRLLDGRRELVEEIEAAASDVRTFILEAIQTMTSDPFFETGVAGALTGGPDAADRLPIVLDRIARLSH
jgi:hypothetical protein